VDVSLLKGKEARGDKAYTHHNYLLMETGVYFTLHARVGR